MSRVQLPAYCLFLQSRKWVLRVLDEMLDSVILHWTEFLFNKIISRLSPPISRGFTDVELWIIKRPIYWPRIQTCDRVLLLSTLAYGRKWQILQFYLTLQPDRSLRLKKLKQFLSRWFLSRWIFRSDRDDYMETLFSDDRGDPCDKKRSLRMDRPT